MNLSARIISYLFHPLLMGTYLFALFACILPAALYPISSQSLLLFLACIAIVTFVLPVLMVSIMRLTGMVQSFTMPTQRERIFPFILIFIVYAVFTYMLTYKSRIGFGDNLFKFLLIIDALVLVAALITPFYKASIHALGMMGLAGILIPLNKESDNVLLLWATVAVVALAGIVMSARLQLHAHTPRQVLVGALLGFLTGTLGMMLLF